MIPRYSLARCSGSVGLDGLFEHCDDVESETVDSDVIDKKLFPESDGTAGVVGENLAAKAGSEL